jgi:ABC-type uncharacterized transport system ATPase subunit
MSADPPLAIDARLDMAYGAAVVLAGATLRVRPGTLHAVVGENGAGKSTLLHIVAGLVRARGGTLALDGVAIDLGRHDVAAARARGLGLVQQHAVAAPTLSVLENAVLGHEPVRRGALALEGPRAALRAVARDVGLAVDPDALVGDLAVGARQRAEIVAALWRGARTLILDEPTAILAPSESDALLALLRQLVARGTTVVLVSHHLAEVAAFADEVTVLRRGETVACRGGRLDVGQLAADVIGEAAGRAGAEPEPGAAPAGRGRALQVDGLHAAGVHEVTFAVGRGELVGIAGIAGNGQDELSRVLTGLQPAAGGRLLVDGRDLTRGSVRARQAAGVAHIPADRQAHGLVLAATVLDNVLLARPELRPRFPRPAAAARPVVDGLLARADVRPPDGRVVAATLSGGNQQKVVVARELDRAGLALVVAAYPTRGVDLGAAARIHERLREVAAAGAGVVVLSADLDELAALCHRVLVMFGGRIVGELASAELRSPAGRVRASALMTGAAGEPEAA